MKKAGSVKEYISSCGEWKESLELLKELLGSSTLSESIKWGMPVYTLDNKNVVGFSAFKSWVGIWFYQGVFLKDKKGMLINAQEGTTKGLRQWRFKSADEIRAHRDTILAYLEEAIRNQEQGKEIKPDRNKTLEIPRELQQAFNQDPSLKDSYHSLSLSKRREFAEHIGSAKQEKTRQQRLQKAIPMIREGIGLSDNYRK